MSNGAGRGRGWLNLATNLEPPKPGEPLIQIPEPRAPEVTEDEFVERIKKINLDDDGILLNQKVIHAFDFWSPEKSEEECKESFLKAYDAAIADRNLQTKLVVLVCSVNNLQKGVFNLNNRISQYTRKFFLNTLQQNFENINEVCGTDSGKLRNFVNLFGEFYYKMALIISSKSVNIKIGQAVLSCLEILLSQKSIQDLAVFTNVLFLIGNKLMTLLSEKTIELSYNVRKVLVLEDTLTRDSKLWLLLALELFNVRFGVLPTEVYQFYEGYLGNGLYNFHRHRDALSIQTIPPSKILDSYKSEVNVLQISTSHLEPKNEMKINGETAGRPILGAGARRKNENTPRKINPIRNKHSEHDDRFETDYN